MKQLLLRLGVDRGLMLLAGGLSLLLLLLLLVGGIWAARLPPAPTVLPDPQALAPAPVLLPETSLASQLPAVAMDSVEDATQVEAGETGGLIEVNNLEQSQDVGITSRPLFWVGRRPVVEGSAPVAVVAGRPRKDEFDQVKLVGVYFAGASSGVIYEHKGERLRLRLEDELLGWKLSMLSADSAVFTQGEDEQKILHLEHANTGKYTAPTKPAAGRATAVEAEGTVQ